MPKKLDMSRRLLLQKQLGSGQTADTVTVSPGVVMVTVPVTMLVTMLVTSQRTRRRQLVCEKLLVACENRKADGQQRQPSCNISLFYFDFTHPSLVY